MKPIAAEMDIGMPRSASAMHAAHAGEGHVGEDDERRAEPSGRPRTAPPRISTDDHRNDQRQPPRGRLQVLVLAAPHEPVAVRQPHLRAIRACAPATTVPRSAPRTLKPTTSRRSPSCAAHQAGRRRHGARPRRATAAPARPRAVGSGSVRQRCRPSVAAAEPQPMGIRTAPS